MDCPTPHPPPLNPHTKTLLRNPENHITQRKAMEKFQQVILKLAESHPNAPLTPAARTLLQDRLSRFVSQYKTPDHPPYSAMIERAIRELNEKRGSSESSISCFLLKEYGDMPWAHSMILKHHLANLCETGDVVLTHNKRYKLAGKIEIPMINSSSIKTNKRKPLRRRWDWEKERSRRHRKMKSIKLRIQQNGKEVKVIEKHQELHDEKEQQLTEENGGTIEANGKTCSDEVSSQHQEIVPSEITQEQPERQQSEYNRPEISKPPGFELARVENSPNSGPAQLEPTSGEEFLESDRAHRQLRRWNRSYPEPKAVTMTPHKSDDNHSLDSNRVSVEQMHHENDVQSVENNVEFKGDKKYSRRRKTKSTQSETIVEPQIEHPSLPLSSNQPDFALSNEKESQELLQQPPHQHEEKQPRRSLRLRLAKPDFTKYESFVIALPSQQHCREDCPETVKPSKQKPINQQAMEPIKPTDCASIREDTDAFETERGKPMGRRLGRLPKRLCARPDNKPETVALDRSSCGGPGQLPKRGRGRPAKVNASKHQ